MLNVLFFCVAAVAFSSQIQTSLSEMMNLIVLEMRSRVILNPRVLQSEVDSNLIVLSTKGA